MPLSGKKMLQLYLQHGWVIDRRKGSHGIVIKDGELPETIPQHPKLKKGLEQKLLKRLRL